MLENPSSEKEGWDSSVALFGNHRMRLGSFSSSLCRFNPKEFLNLLARYKFAAKLACKRGTILELGCGDGVGATILGENIASYLGIDPDPEAIQVAIANTAQSFAPQKYRFLCDPSRCQIRCYG